MFNSNDPINMSLSPFPPGLVTLPTSAAADLVDFPVSVFSYPPYLQQEECVKDCIWHSGSTATDLIIALGCTGPWINGCYCGNGSDDDDGGGGNYEHARAASIFVRRCVAESCRTPSTDALVTSGFGVYNEYCAEAGLRVPEVVARTSTAPVGFGEVTSTGMASGERTGPTAGVGLSPGMSSDSGGPGELTSPGLSTGAKVGIAVGSTAAVLLLAVSAFITWRLKVKARVSLSRRKDVARPDESGPGTTNLPPLQVIRHSGLPAASTRYN